ncbi:hypothetical protein HXZ61_09155 [Acinetobacter indicus]|jgi:hypothetical protein|uniref:hypothetical protein n=1 Tax=Acinetobacter TaxID=469 RepID=UPI002575F5CC|nr:hypothetical protein [Acinetobacter indicus]MDM1270363.1 hypothetical protein [Acinetobacter indicus]
MQFLKDSFADVVRKGKIPSPLSPKFDVKKWDEAEKKTKFDENLCYAGKFFYLQFDTLRQALKELTELNRPLSNKDYLQFFSGISNRTIKILNDDMEEKIKSSPLKTDFGFFAHKHNSNPLKIDFSTEEVATLSVDGIFYNILSNLRDNSAPSNDDLKNEDILSTVFAENMISQLYYIYESYWNSILYEQINFMVQEGKVILKSNAEIMIPYEISNIRKSKVNVANIMNLSPVIDRILSDKKIIDYDGENFSIKKIGQLDSRKKNTITTAWYGYQDKIISFLSKDLPNKNFNLDDLIELFIQLSSLGYDLFKSLPKDDGIKPGDLNKLRMFSPTIKIEILVDALTQSLAQDRYIILEMLEFLTFTGNSSKKGPRADLWRTPLIKLNESEFILILESIMHPIGIRCIEGWLTECGVDLQGKGTEYEQYIKTTLSSVILDNDLLSNSFLIAENEEISVNGVTEEIDLLFKIDNLIVLGEAKCVVVNDSAISYWHSIEIIKKASEQASRKINFIRKNIKDVFKLLKWDYDENIKFIFQPIVLMSNFIGVGYSFFDVPVVDTVVLNNYFEKNICPLLSLSESEHIAFLKLYENKEELINNFSLYVENPPSIESYKLFTEVITSIPVISPMDSYQSVWEFERIGISAPDIDKLLNHDYKFPLVKIDNLEKVLAELAS